jgi:hypothetical protein
MEWGGGFVGLGWCPVDLELAFERDVFLGGVLGAMGGGVEVASEGEAGGVGFEGDVAEFEFEEGPTLVVEGVEEVGPVWVGERGEGGGRSAVVDISGVGCCVGPGGESDWCGGDLGEVEESVGGGVEVVPEFFDELGAGLGDEFREPGCFEGVSFPVFEGGDELECFGAGLVARFRWGGVGVGGRGLGRAGEEDSSEG